MPVPSVTTQNQILDAWLGPNRAAGTPDAYSLELWAGDPRDEDSAEVSGNGYDPVDVDADDFGPAADGQTASTLAYEWVESVGEWSDTATHYALRDPATDEVAFCGPLKEPVDVSGPGTVRVRPIVFFGDQN